MRTKKLPKKPRWKDKIDPDFDEIIKKSYIFQEVVDYAIAFTLSTFHIRAGKTSFKYLPF